MGEHATKSGDLVECVGWPSRYGEQCDGSHQTLDDVAKDQQRHQQRRRVGEHNLHAVTAPYRAGPSVDGISSACTSGQRRGVTDDGARGDPDALAGTVEPPAEVDVVPEQRPAPVETAEAIPDLAPDKQTGGAAREDVADIVVLSLVDLTRLEPTVAATGAVRRQPYLTQKPAVP